MHEIVTIQIGSQSNYIGTHFWNVQESYFTYAGQEESPVDHDIHFRQGIGADGSDTFTPRTLVYDFKNNFGSLRRINELYEELGDQQNQGNVWEGSTVPQRLPSVQPNSYQRSLEAGEEPPEITQSEVRYWSDFNRVFYHPRSLVQIYDTELDPGQRAFNDWSSGEELFASLSREEDLLDRDLRPFVEECDQMQGMQIFADVTNGWAGFSAKYMNRLRDEFGKLSVWVSGVNGPSQDTMAIRAAKMVNQARALHELSQQSSIYIPVTALPLDLPSYVSMNVSHPWHLSAFQCSGLESILLPTRLKTSSEWNATSLDQVTVLLNGESDHRIAQLSFDVADTVTSEQYTNGNSHDSMQVRGDVAGQSGCRLFSGDEGMDRDEREPRLFAEVETERGQWNEDQEMTEDSQEQDRMERRRLLKLSSTVSMPLPDSFPKIFSTRDRLAARIPVRTRLSVSSSIGVWARSLEQATRMRVPFDDREELSNGLKTIGEAYAGGFEGDEEDNDEDWDG